MISSAASLLPLHWTRIWAGLFPWPPAISSGDLVEIWLCTFKSQLSNLLWVPYSCCIFRSSLILRRDVYRPCSQSRKPAIRQGLQWAAVTMARILARAPGSWSQACQAFQFPSTAGQCLCHRSRYNTLISRYSAPWSSIVVRAFNLIAWKGQIEQISGWSM